MSLWLKHPDAAQSCCDCLPPTGAEPSIVYPTVCDGCFPRCHYPDDTLGETRPRADVDGVGVMWLATTYPSREWCTWENDIPAGTTGAAGVIHTGSPATAGQPAIWSWHRVVSRASGDFWDAWAYTVIPRNTPEGSYLPVADSGAPPRTIIGDSVTVTLEVPPP